MRPSPASYALELRRWCGSSRTRTSRPCDSQVHFKTMLSRLMQNPLGAAFARKVLRCKARDEGRTLVLFDETRNAAAGHFSCKPFGAVLGGARRSGRAKATAQRRRAIDRAPRPCFAPSTARAIICFVASLANSPAIRLRLASRISPRQAAPRPHGVLHQPATLGTFHLTLGAFQCEPITCSA